MWILVSCQMLQAFTDYTRFVLTALLGGIAFQENSMLS